MPALPYPKFGAEPIIPAGWTALLSAGFSGITIPEKSFDGLSGSRAGAGALAAPLLDSLEELALIGFASTVGTRGGAGIPREAVAAAGRAGA